MKRLFAVTVFLFFALSASAAGGAPQQATAAAPTAYSAADTAAALAAIDPAKKTDIARLVEVTGMKNAMSQTFEGMVTSGRQQVISLLPPGNYREKLVDLFYERFRAKLDLQKMIDIATVAYDRYFSDEDIKSLIQFYQTPIGQKALSILPKMTVEIMSQSTGLGAAIGEESMKEVLDEHPELKKAMEDASQ